MSTNNCIEKDTDKRLWYFTQEGVDFRESLAQVLTKNLLYNEADRFRDCGGKFNTFVCENHEDHDYDNTKAFAFPYYCELRICGRCGYKRANISKEDIEAILQHRSKTKTNKFALLTLTQNMSSIRNLDQKDVKKFNKNVRKLINKLYPKKSGSGALAVLEFGKNLNMHAHIIVFGPYYQQAYLSEKWKKITGDSFIVDIRALRDYKKVSAYLVKYIAKPPSFDDKDHYSTFLEALKGGRRLHRYGIFYGFKARIREVLRCPYCGGSLQYVILDDSFGVLGCFLYGDELNQVLNESKFNEDN